MLWKSTFDKFLFNTLLNLGITNLVRVALYKVLLKLRLHKSVFIRSSFFKGPFFIQVDGKIVDGLHPSQKWENNAVLFSVHNFKLQNEFPSWHANSFKPEIVLDKSKPWFRYSDFNTQSGDIKIFWELSRMEWLLPMAQRAFLSKKTKISKINDWLSDWCESNPPYYGVNWKCGQEASIRVMNVATATILLRTDTIISAALSQFIKVHLYRIEPTLGYAIGQANNHGTSEAAALFIGGSLIGGKDGLRWANLGRKILENRAATLFMEDGSFSQYSLTYHRFALNTYALCEIVRKRHSLKPFSETLYCKLSVSTKWMISFIDPSTGDVPNIGANDGAQLLSLIDSDYRDFRSSAQLNSALFCGLFYKNNGDQSNQALKWLEVDPPDKLSEPAHSETFSEGGFHLLRNSEMFAVLRVPQFRFRPSHADALHLDLWVNGTNIFRDGGSFSYADKKASWFASVEAHNTIQFDARDQMPRYGRFLFGAWLKAKNVIGVHEENGTQISSASYTDSKGASHTRRVELGQNWMICTDDVKGFAESAVLKWRVPPGDWILVNGNFINNKIKISVTADVEKEMCIYNSIESRYYTLAEPITVLETVVKDTARIITKVVF